MIVERDNKTKARLFAQYWGQEVARTKWKQGWSTTRLTEVDPISATIDYLELKSISNISDEDLELVGFASRKGLAACVATLGLEGMWIDYLRSKGYALPFMGIPVEEQIELGWIKIIE